MGWYYLNTETKLPVGLTIDEVQALIQSGQVNTKQKSNLKSINKIIYDNLFSYFNLILGILALLLISIGSYENLFFVLIAFINTFLGIYQEIKARNTILKLSLLSEPTAKVRRQNLEIEIAIHEIVLGDIYLLSPGKQIVTDAVIMSGQVSVNEANLTGESDAIVKTVGDKVLSGSFVVSGSCYAEVVAVGKDNYIEQLSSKVMTLGKPSSQILSSLKNLLKVIGIIIVPLGFLTFYNAFVRSGLDYLPDFIQTPDLYQNALKKMAGSMVAMVPSGLFLLTTGTFFMSVTKLAKRNTLVQELYSIETLARIDMICLDKTGTLTDGQMQVASYVSLFKEPDLEETSEETQVIEKNPLMEIDIEGTIQSMNYFLSETNQTAKALEAFFGKKRKYRGRDKLNFDSKNKYSVCTFDHGAFAIGAPEMVYKGKYTTIKKEVEKYAKTGKRVLLFAKVKGIKDDKLVGPVDPLGLILINDHIRPSCKATLEEFEESGVEIKIISGDNALTVSEVANRAGVPNAKKYLSLDKISDETLVSVCHDYTVFGRVSPKQKKLLIETFQGKQGKKVAMVGDGVNDILALKASNCSIALVGGSEAASNISHLVLLDNDFASLPKVVKEGRQIVNNMQNASVLYLVKTMYTILLTFILLFTSQIYPFEPVQMFVIETFIIGIPSFFIALEPNNLRFQGIFLINVFKKVIPGTVLVIANLIGVYVFAKFWPSVTDGEISTVGIVAATFAYFLVLVNVCMPLNKRRQIIVLASLFVSGFCFLVLGQIFFKLQALTLPSLLLLLLLMETTYIITSISKRELIKFWV